MAKDDNKTDDTATKKVIDSTSPFYLSSSENPRTMISSCVLKGDNYDLWEKAMKNALRAKNKLGFVNGSIIKPAAGPEANLWESCNSMLVSWLFNSIDSTLQPSIAYMETAKELWDDLRERFSIGNGPRIHQLKADIAAAKQQGQSVVSYYTRLKGMWDELSSYSRVPVCKCKGCTCNAAAEFVKEREEEKIHQFLMGLDDSVFGTVRSSILGMEPLPTLNKVYSMVIQEERHRSVVRGREERGEAVGFAVQAVGFLDSQGGPKPAKVGLVDRPSCTHCGKMGHEVSRCYELIGYPEGWGRGGRTGRGGRGGGRGARGRGHVHANAVQGSFNAGASYSAGASCGASAGASHGAEKKHEPQVSIPGLSDVQMQQIMAILTNSNASASYSAGASTEKLHGPQYEDADWCGSDNGTEFKSGLMLKFYAANGILHQTSLDQNTGALGTNAPDESAGASEDSASELSVGASGQNAPELSAGASGQNAPELSAGASGQEAPGHSAPASNLTGRVPRSRKPPAHLQDYMCYTAFCDPSKAHPITVDSSGSLYPIAHYLNYNKFSVAHRIFLNAVTAGREPQHFGEAVKDVNWRNAMQAEIDALERNRTWTVEDLPPTKTAIGCKWVYRIKYNSDGSIERYKARLVVLGNRQIEGIDYTETFAPVAKMVSVRTFLAVAIAKGWELHQMDVHNAFLHGDLNEEVYMRLPPGFNSSQPGKVCRLRKSLYGLRQAPRMWFSKLSAALQFYGFVQSKADYSLFSYTKGDVFLAILVYVDDLVIAGNNSEALKGFKQYLSSTFHMKDLGALKYFLGIEITRGPEGLFLCQRKYTLDILAESGLLGAKPAAFPIEQNHQLLNAIGPPMDDPERYRRIVGRLIYLTITRPELCYSVHVLAQFMQAPLQAHYDAAIRVLRYLKGNPGQGVVLRADSDLRLYAYCDSDWASCPLTRRSLTGYFVMLGQSPISWKTKKQHTVSRSSAEAEYRSMATTACELTWLKSLLQFLGVSHTQPMKLFCDSQAAIHIASNPVFHERTKHIEVDCHYVRDSIRAGHITTSHVRTTEQLADIFTKALGKRQFQYLLSKLGIRDLHAPT
ncbi:Retroelement pol polyprotein-like [Rhynchospora pubera]|uniref:Retroelement pol polyprotein-like n=1 Tax=Rhynchospora pubera TaxID=906938 RepID=A0AAV8FAI7_9POAL|nr:Retroelement pol polyprotein-like [Rhynchospora pubera]